MQRQQKKYYNDKELLDPPTDCYPLDPQNKRMMKNDTDDGWIMMSLML